MIYLIYAVLFYILVPGVFIDNSIDHKLLKIFIMGIVYSIFIYYINKVYQLYNIKNNRNKSNDIDYTVYDSDINSFDGGN